MPHWIRTQEVRALEQELKEHALYGCIECVEQLRFFMEHHVYAVWDFMSLVKCLQHAIAPTTLPWYPRSTPSARRFINEIVLAEESDLAPGGEPHETRYASHFELYLEAMREVGAETKEILRFVQQAVSEGSDAALKLEDIPPAARRFVRSTLRYTSTDDPHIVAAVFAVGREQLIPTLFASLLEEMGLGERAAPTFHYYLRRHVAVDRESHGPMAERLLDELCSGDPEKIDASVKVATQALDDRLVLWGAILEQLPSPAPRFGA